MSLYLLALLTITILAVAPGLTVAGFADWLQKIGINTDDFKDNSTSLDETAGNVSTKYEQKENIHSLSMDSKINDLIDMVNTTNTRLDMLTTSQAHAQARFDQLEASIKALGEVAKNVSIASLQEKTIYIPFIHSKKSWSAAFEDCRARNMDLASIENEVEYVGVMEQVFSVGTRPERVDFWISGQLDNDDGRFKWMSNNHTVTYNKWYEDQPDQNEECPGGEVKYCIEINQRLDNKWNDYCCSRAQYYICQIKI